MNSIFCKSSENMCELNDASISLTITSPPYWNVIDYDKYINNAGDNYRSRSYNNGFGEYSEYLEWLTRIFSETLRVTKDGGFCAVIVGTILKDGKHIPLPFHFVNLMGNIGWSFHQDIIWHKVTAGIKRAGVAIQHPYPGYYYPNIMTEYILIFRRGNQKIFKGVEDKICSAYDIDDVFKLDIANNVWHIAPVPPRTISHPCPFPEEIPYRLIKLYSYMNDIVLDPFCGSGQTLKVANALGRQYVGYDIYQEYVSISQDRVSESLHIRDKQLIARFDKT